MKVLLASDQRTDPTLLARHLAGRLEACTAELDVLTVIPGIEELGDQPEGNHGVIGIAEGAHDYHQACAHVATLAAQLHEHGFRHVRTHVEYGDPAEVILASSRTWHSQLLLIGAPRRRGLLTAFRLDGVTWRLLRWADCPVELIRPDAAQADPRSIILPLSAAALTRLPLAALQSLPWQDGDQLHLLCAMPPGFDETRAEASPAAALLALQQGRDACGRASSRLDAIRTELENLLPVRVKLTHEVVEGSLSEHTMRSARDLRPGLMVLNSSCLDEHSKRKHDEPPTALALSLPCSVLFLPDDVLAQRPRRSVGQARILKFAR